MLSAFHVEIASASKRGSKLSPNLHENKHASETQFHMKGFTSISISGQMLISIRYST